MTTLKGLKGTAIQFLDEDPVVYVGTWSSAGALNTNRAYSGGSGIATSGVIFGGYTTPGSYVGNTETYNGTAFTEVNDMSTGRGALGYAGATQSNALAISGVSPYRTNVEKWDGSSWTETGDVSVARNSGSGAGTSTAAIYFGGSSPALSPTRTASNESFNGSSWTEVGDLNTAKGQMAGSGTSTSAFAIAGSPNGSALLSTVEQWNGSAWTETTDINTARRSLGASSGSGTVTATLIFGGYATPAQVANTESWDGSAWTEVADMAAARSDFAGTGTTTSALASGGEPNYGATEEWSFPPATASTLQEGDMWFNSSSSTLKGYGTAAGIPAATWSSGGNLNTGRNYLPEFSFATQTAGFAVGGNISPKQQTEQYNGSSWTEVADLNSTLYGRAGFGTNASAVVAGGNGPPASANSETWDNSSWTEGNNLNTARRDAAGAGITTAGLVIGAPAVVESYNGTSYTEVADLNTGRSELGGGGTSTSALVFGGYPSTAATESWDGTSWTEVSDLNSARSDNGTACISNQGALYFGNGNEYWNGSSWTEVNDLSTSRVGLGGNGTTTSALAFGGYPITASTEEFTVPEANSTITVS